VNSGKTRGCGYSITACKAGACAALDCHSRCAANNPAPAPIAASTISSVVRLNMKTTPEKQATS